MSLFILYVHEHDRLGFGMLTVETAILNPRAVSDCLCGISFQLRQKSSVVSGRILFGISERVL